MTPIEVILWIEVLRVLVSLSFLFVSSWYDYKFREVPNRIWILFAPIGFTSTLIQHYLEYINGEGSTIFLYWAVSIGVTAGISLLLFYAGFFGGADAKALICLSITIPIYPRFSYTRFKVMLPIFPLAVLINAVFTSSLLVIIILCRNLIGYVRLKEEMFKGLEHEPCWRKILVFMTGIRVDWKNLKSGAHYIPLEYFVKEKDGEVTRHLRVSPQLEEGGLISIEGFNGQVWVTPGLPFLIFITIGFTIALFFGDFSSWLIDLMLSS